MTAEAETALSVHYRRVPPAIARIREPEYTQDDVTFNIRWVTVVASLSGPRDRFS